MTMSTLFFWGFAFNAVVVLGISTLAAAMFLLGRDMKNFAERVLPATGIMVGGSLAAGLIMWAAGKFFGS